MIDEWVEVSYVPDFDFIAEKVVPDNPKRPSYVTEYFRRFYYNMLYWAWCSGNRTPRGYPFILISVDRLIQTWEKTNDEWHSKGWDEDPLPEFPVSRRSFFRWFKELEDRKLIRRKRVKDGVNVTVWLPKDALALLNDFDIHPGRQKLFRDAWRNQHGFGGTKVKIRQDSAIKTKDSATNLSATKREDSASKTGRNLPKVHKGIDDTRPVTRGIEKREVRNNTNNLSVFPPVTGKRVGVGVDSLEEILAKGKARSAGKTRYAVTKHRPTPTNPYTRDYSVRWWQQQVREHLGIPSARAELQKVPGPLLTQDWEADLWEEWYRVMDVMIRKWPEFKRWLLSKGGGGGTRLTDAYPPYEWRNTAWWKTWVGWSADQLAMEKHIQPNKSTTGKKSFL